MQRRRFLKTVILPLGIIGFGGGIWLSSATRRPLSSGELLTRLNMFLSEPPQFAGNWNCYQTFCHMAQSVEFSMLGFPEHKSKLFKSTIGRSAYNLFAQKGRMYHNLEEPIPGAPKLMSVGDEREAVARLIAAFEEFRDFKGELKPHFTFGELDHAAYELAHILHIQNHLEQVVT